MECLQALQLKGDLAEEAEEDRMVGMKLVAEALLALVGFRMPDDER